MKGSHTDEEARLDALDSSRSFHVESPAGSGKTMLLTTRFLKLLAMVEQPGEILALTYTDKAARQMRSRIVEALQMARRGGVPSNPAEGKLLAAAGDALRRHGDRIDLASTSQALNIMTFHGFCYYLAARAPLEAGMAPGFGIADEATQKQMAAESASSALDRLKGYPPDDPRRKALENRALHRDNNWKMLADELAYLIRQRDRFADLVSTISRRGTYDLPSFTEAMKERLGSYAERRLGELHRAFSGSQPGQGWADFIAHLEHNQADAAELLPRTIPGTTWKNLEAWRTMADCFLTKQGMPRQRLGPGTGFYSGFQKSSWGRSICGMNPSVAALLAETRNLPAEDDPSDEIEVLSDLILLSAEAIEDYNRLCAGRSVTDFIGIEQCALKVLGAGEPSDLMLYLDHRLTHILIDEFQDINRTQWELLQRLVSGWEPGDGRTVFIVGDPKQSIYAFRNAEVSLFFEAKEGIPRPGYESLVPESRLLATNFRSGAALVEWVNDLFGKTVMADPDFDADEVPFSPSVPGSNKDGRGIVSLALFEDEEREEALCREAAWLASTASRFVEETGGSQSLGILLFTRNRLARYLKALREWNVPVQVREGLHLADRPEVQHMLNLLTLLARPQDDLAWASLLRSPWCWCDLSVLAEAALWPESSWIDRLRGLAQEQNDLRNITSALDDALARIGRDAAGTVIRRLWEDLDGPARTAARYGMRGVSNCVHLCRLIEGLDEGTPQDTLARLETLLDDWFEPSDPATARSPVELMTIHRAKGLEFDAVILPFLDWEPRSGTDDPYLLERVPGTKGEHLIATKKDRRAEDHSPLYRLLSRFEKARSQGEAKRWFYVAATRARSRLYMSGVTGWKKDALVAPPESPLAWIMKHEGLQGLITRGAGDISLPERTLLSFTINPHAEGSPGFVGKGSPFDLSGTELPEPLYIEPERPGLSVTTPTSSKGEPEAFFFPEGEYTAPENQDYPPSAAIATIRGTLIHRLLKRYMEKRLLPSPDAVAATLRREGFSSDEALFMAREVLKDTVKTVNSPFIGNLLKTPGAQLFPEWKLEGSRSSSSVLSGAIDLAAFDGEIWWVIDFKSGSPGPDENIDTFMALELNRHGKQLRDYGMLLRDYCGDQAAPIRCGIFFTALGTWREIQPPLS